MKDLILSSTSIQQFKNCRKAFELGYVMLLDPGGSKAASDGTSIHKFLADAAKGKTIEPESEMYDVAEIYLRNHPLPAAASILYVEEPQYVKIAPKTHVRATFDLVYRDEDGWIVCRDYKTFDKWPSLSDSDWDFQARFYIAFLMKRFKTDKVRFEWEYIRRTPPGVPHNKKGEVWTAAECYLTVPMVIPATESDQVWLETKEVIRDIRAAIKRGSVAFYRQDRKGGYNGCGGCFYKHLCLAQIQGVMDEQTIDLLSTPRKPLQLPQGQAT